MEIKMSNKGILVIAQNNASTNYVEQACLLAMSLKIHDTIMPISLVTDDTVPDCYRFLFDHIIPIPWSDSAEFQEWKIANRWKLYHVTPYDETIVLDTDMIVTEQLSNYWKFLSNYDLYFVNHVLTYRHEKVTSDFYRKTFTSNNLPNLYSGFHYFKKCTFSYEFYTWLEIIMKHWEQFYQQHLITNIPPQCSVDVACAIATKILDCEDKIVSKLNHSPTFVHMKTKVQNWKTTCESWQDVVGIYVDEDCNLMIGNHSQTKLFHYTENSFVTKSLIDKFRKKLDV